MRAVRTGKGFKEMDMSQTLVFGPELTLDADATGIMREFTLDILLPANVPSELVSLDEPFADL